MIANLPRSYRVALVAAITLHLSIVVLLLSEHSSARPVMEKTDLNDAIELQASAAKPEPQAIKAVSVDSQEVLKTVNRLKTERLNQQRAEENRQKALAQQAESARKQRLEEQAKIEKLKTEANNLAIAHKKQLEDEKRHIEELAKLKEQETKRLADMKKQQQAEATKLAELKKKKDAELAKAESERAEKAAQKANAAAESKRQAAIQQAAADAERNAKISGEVDKYKAMIISAISRQWILPENANSNLSSQFRIRLAPDGAVLDLTLTRSSGDPILDRSAQAAIYKASPLPVPTDPQTFNLFRDISLTVRPENARG